MKYRNHDIDPIGKTPNGGVVYGPIEHSKVGETFQTNGSGEVVVRKAGINERGKIHYLVEFAETGYTQWMRQDRVRNGGIKDPTNWVSTHVKTKDETGNVYGKLTVVSFHSIREYESGGTTALWNCVCDCGGSTVSTGSSLRAGTSMSCGCVREEKTKFINRKHGLYLTPEYNVLCGMRDRCYNENNQRYENYGGRGIKICDRWMDAENGFQNFFKDMGERPDDSYSIERVDNDGDYTPENCEWVVDEVQVNNRRRNKNNLSGRTGVYHDERSGKWGARLHKGKKGDSKYVYLGLHETFEGAVRAREEAELKYFGKIKE